MPDNSTNQPNQTRSSHGARGLEAKFAIDDSIFQKEQAELFQDHWICAGTTFELQGQSLLVKRVNGNSILVTIDADNQVRCFYNVCRHRGAELVNGHQPNCQTADMSEIVCPYHAWRYSLSGMLKTAPNMHDVDNFRKTDFGLRSIPCRIWNSLIWICFSEQPREFDADFGELDPLVAPWEMSNLSCHKTISYAVQANWKLIFQNYNECYHCPTVHPALNRLTPYKNTSNDFVEGSILGGPMQLSEQSESMTTDGMFAGIPLPSLSLQQQRSVVYYTVFPSVFISLHPDYVLFHRLLPSSAGETLVFCDFLFAGKTNETNASRRETAVRFWDETNLQDWQVCERVQQGMRNPGYVPGPYSNLESLVAAFDRHYLNTINHIT